MRQPEIHQGTSPATAPGAIRRKKTVPTTAETRLVASELNATEPGPTTQPSSHYISMKAGNTNTRAAR
jgi:hypothetical protein